MIFLASSEGISNNKVQEAACQACLGALHSVCHLPSVHGAARFEHTLHLTENKVKDSSSG